MKQLYFFRKKTASILFSATALICSLESQAQNLVLNPSFEDVNPGSLQCSWYTSQAQFNNAINFWTCPTGGSTDIFNTALATTCYCSPFSTNASSPGTQAPRTGNGYVNIVTYGNGGCTPWREYIQGQLSSALVPGQTYEVEMWVTLADKMAVGTNNIGVKFSTDPYVQASNCPYYTTPDLNYTGPIITDKDNWVQIIFCYTPTVAGLDNFIIGNFYNDAATATAAASGVTTGNTIRYFVEDVRVELVTGSGNAGSDGTLTTCGGNPSSDLFSSLNGLPDTGGSWTGPSALPGGYLGTFDPSIHLPGVYTYSVGGSGLCAGGSSSATVTVSFTNPTANIPAITPVCEGTPISLTENGGAATTWSWSSDGSATFSDPSIQSPTISGVVDGETFSVSISDGSGCTNTANYMVSLNSAPVVSANDNGPYCANDPMSVSETGGEAISWSWTSNGSAVFSNAADQNPTITGAVDGEIFTVTATDINGCSNTAQAVFTINALPTVSADDNGPYCANDLMSVSETGGSATSWSWTSNGSAAFSNASDQNPTITGAVDGEIFTVSATDINGCSNTAQAVFTINALPTVSADDNGPYCVNDPMSVSENGGTATSWSWTSNGSATFSNASDQNPTVTGAVDGEIFTVTATDINGCSNTAQAVFTINALPVVTADDNGPYCANDPMSVSETGGAATSWSWTSNGSAVFSNASDQNPTITGAVDGEIFTVTATDINGCSNTAQAVFTINALPTVSADDNGPYCTNDPMSVSETGGSATSWTWTSNGSAAFSNTSVQNPTITGAIDGEIFTVTATDVNGCSNTAQAVFTINALPIVSAVNDSPVCTGASVNLDESGGNGVSWIWTSNGGGIIGNSSAQSTSVTGASNGEIFTVTITDVNGCINSGTTTVTVVTQPVLDLVNDTTVCDNFILPAVISGTNLSGSEAYYTDSQINGGTVISGPITTSQTIYIYDGSNGCSDEISFDVTVNSLPTVTNTSGGGTYCQGSIVNDILVDVTGSPDWTIDYTLDGVSMSSTSTLNPVSLGNTPGVYIVTNITDANCTNVGTGTETIIVNPTPGTPAAGSDSVYCLGDTYVDLFANGGTGTLTWYDDASLTSIIGTGTNLSPIIQTGTTSYYVTETLNGCEGPASIVSITINDCTEPVIVSINIPTAFTPDLDGHNDDWEIINLDTAYPNNSVSVFNRWGNILFFHDSGTEGPYDQNRWDGTYNGVELPVGSYYYVIEFNNPENDKATGAVSIIRD